MKPRREYLKALGLAGTVGIAGCTGSSPANLTTTDSDQTETPSTKTTLTETVTPRSGSHIVVGPDGTESNPGTEDAPLGRIQSALDKAQPGDTVQVKPGEYREGFGTTRAGTPEAPITITGPAEAVVRPPVDNPGEGGVSITHSHVHLIGLTLDGLADRERADDPESYARFVVRARPPSWQDTYPDYLTDVKIKPHRIGNAGAKLIATSRVNELEIGEFELIGPAGAMWFRGGRGGYVLGEIVSMGRSSNNFDTEAYPWEGPDRSHDVHVHHIANLAGHRHTELVKVHAGMYDVTVEYCTDDGGFGREGGGGSSIALNGAHSTARWCRLSNGLGNGVSISVLGSPESEAVHDQFGTIPEDRYPGRNNAVYRNEFSNLKGQPFVVDTPAGLNGYDLQRAICGNDSELNADDRIAEPCPEPIPEGDGIGHLGGDSPWG